MAYSSLNHNNWYVSTEDGKFYYSLDSGQDFIQTASFSGPESHYFYGSTILPSPTNNQRIYIGGSGYSNPAIYLSEDGGETFLHLMKAYLIHWYMNWLVFLMNQ